jgi:hypothetical protein
MARRPRFYGAAAHRRWSCCRSAPEVTLLCAPSLAPAIRGARPLRAGADRERQQAHPLATWFAANGLPSAARRASTAFIRPARRRTGWRLPESTLLAEREIASGWLVLPLAGICEDVATGHWRGPARQATRAPWCSLAEAGARAGDGLEELEEIIHPVR